MSKLKEWWQILEEVYRNAPISKTTNTDIWFDEKGHANFVLKFNKGVCHALGDIHGGIIAVMIDNATWFTAAGQYPWVWITTLELHTYIVKPPMGKDIYSKGSIIHKGKRVAVAKAEVTTEDGTLIAYGTGSFVVLPHIKLSLEEVKKKLSEF
ncbi:thioesterase [Thermosulfidibacter takaii ABI70S6]|uniref:Thioesterase n=1 Tax=Thermosulfidibacter takaii (strain DSM 17441 / JCM 13301 / NBRC 103674 / ABI70S6) TaxID=1298851 RepID=A0A0S3QTB5_THET7|nr:PaaI family thioesterase [Thermosulfidibacter takaii]BAT71537.1 thioesterase [Thermosulfidibacter takaii ABI70S6]